MTHKAKLFEKANGIERIEFHIQDDGKWLFDVCYNISAEWLEKAMFINKIPLIRNTEYFKRELKSDELIQIANLCANCSHMMYTALCIDPSLKIVDWTEEVRKEALKEECELYGWTFD